MSQTFIPALEEETIGHSVDERAIARAKAFEIAAAHAAPSLGRA